MQFKNMMDLENTSYIEIWQDTTSYHIEKYWNSRPFRQVVVQEVSTLLLRQEIVIIPQQRRRLADDGSLTKLHNLYYQQNITLGYLRVNGRLAIDENAIFVEPFRRSEVEYTDNLAANLNVDPGTDIQLIQTEVLDGGNPTSDTSTGSGGSLSTGTIVLIVIASVIILTGGLGGYWYLRRRQHENDKAWATENARHVDEEDEFALDDDDYPVVVQSQGSSDREESAGDDGNDEDTGPYSDPSENYLNQLPDDDEDDPRLPYTRDPAAEGPRSRGTLDDISDGESGEDVDPVSPNRATSSCGSSVDDPPSLSAFQVTVTDLDD
jgi:hypothetical protein